MHRACGSDVLRPATMHRKLPVKKLRSISRIMLMIASSAFCPPSSAPQAASMRSSFACYSWTLTARVMSSSDFFLDSSPPLILTYEVANGHPPLCVHPWMPILRLLSNTIAQHDRRTSTRVRNLGCAAPVTDLSSALPRLKVSGRDELRS